MSGIDLSTASRLCMACGMCCDGTIFRHAFMTEDDLVLANQLGMEVVRKEDGILRFKQPCPRFNSYCTVYDKKKPSVCGDFSCKLLDSVIADSSQFEDALAKVKKARLLHSEVTKLLADVNTVPLSYEDVMDRAWPLQANAVLRKENARLLMAVAAFDVHLFKYFIHKK